MIATITSKGQVTLPVEARRRLGLTPGVRVDCVINEHDHLEMIPVAGSVRDLRGMLEPPSSALSLDDMDQAIADGAMS